MSFSLSFAKIWIQSAIGSFLTITLLLFIGCAPYKAVVQKESNLQYEKKSVNPSWEYRNRKGAKLIAPAIGAAVGAAVALIVDKPFISDTDTTSKEKVLLFSVSAGLFGGALLNGPIFSKRALNNGRYSHAQKDEWLKSYNKKNDVVYSIVEQGDEQTLIIAPLQLVKSARSEASDLVSRARRTPPALSWKELSSARIDLKEKYSILPKSERYSIEQTLSNREQSIANAEISNLKRQFQALPNNEESLQFILTSKREYASVFEASSRATKEDFDNSVDAKTESILSELAPIQERRIKSVGSEVADIEVLNSIFRDYDSKFSVFEKYASTRSVYSEFERKKTDLLDANMPKLESTISRSGDSRLRGLRSSLLDSPEPNEPTYSSIKRLLDKRRNQLIDQRLAERNAEQNRKRKEEQNRKREEEQSKAALSIALGSVGIITSLTSNELERKIRGSEADIFSTKGLRYEKNFINILVGNFQSVTIARDEVEFVTVIQSYLNSYARQCKQNLPRNSIELTQQVCISGFRSDYGGVDCQGWRTEGTGLFASPEMFKALAYTQEIQRGDSDFWKILFQCWRNPQACAGNTQGKSEEYKRDVAKLFTQIDCNSFGMKRFEENLRRFALNEDPIPIDRASPDPKATQRKRNNLKKDQDYVSLANDIITKNASGWVYNRFKGISSVRVSQRDLDGLPQELSVSYMYSGTGSNGTARIVFRGGVPECIYFHDNPTNCKVPDRDIVRKFLAGGYAK